MTMNLKHIMAGVAAVATLLSGGAITGSAMAEDKRIDASNLNESARQTLTVTANEDISNRTLKAVPLAYYSYAQTDADGKTITGFDLIDAGKHTAIADALQKAGINTSNPASTTGTKYKYDESNPMVWVVQNLLDSENSPWAGQLRNFLDKLKNEDAVTGKNGANNNATEFTKGSDTEEAKKKQTASVRPGVYAVVDTTTSGQASIVMFNGTGIDGKTTLKNGDKTYTLGTVNYKVHGTTVTKKITAAPDGSVATDDTSAETSIGKTVSFEMDSKVPNWTGYDKYYYAINDTYSKGLTFDENTAELQVKVNNTTLTKDTDYKIATGTDTTSGNATFTILFAPTTGDTETSSDIVKMKDKFPVGADVKVTYDMTVNKDAVAGTADTNVNEVEYSHNPNTVTDHAKTPGNTVNVYTGKFTLTKTDTNKTPLAGAVFNITENGKTDPVKFVKVSDNEYRVADATETNGSADITTTDKNNGVITLKGLYGKYTVKETSSPFNGSILPSFTLTVGVTPSSDKTTSTSSLTSFEGDSNKLASENSDNKGVTVINARNLLDMPKTGVTWLCIFGAMTVLLAGGAFLLLRKGKDLDRA